MIIITFIKKTKTLILMIVMISLISANLKNHFREEAQPDFDTAIVYLWSICDFQLNKFEL